MRSVPEPKIAFQIRGSDLYAVYDDPWTGRQKFTMVRNGERRDEAAERVRRIILVEHQTREEDRLTYGGGGRPSRRKEKQ